jgi:hypothetical protein
MDKSQFLDKFLNEIEQDKVDVFEELDNISNDTILRRFSFSIPDDLDIHDISAPPSSPNLDFIDFKKDIFIQVPTEFSLDNNDNESLPPTPRDIQETISFPKEILFTSSENDNQLYKMPPHKSHDARKIWKHARIPSVATIRLIESKLLDWAFYHARLEITSNYINNITWKSDSGYTYNSKWNVFIHWMICATVSV